MKTNTEMETKLRFFQKGFYEFWVLSFLFISLGYCAAALAGDLDRFAGLEGTLSIAGGTAHIPVMNDAAKAIMTAYPKIRIIVEGGGSGVGVQKVGTGLVDIGNTGRDLSAEEISKYGLVSFPFALDGVAVVVHPGNPISGLTARQIREIFSGTITNWSMVGGREGTIHLFTRDEASGTREVFWEKLLNKGLIDSGANVVPSNGAMKVAVAQDINAIGYIGIGHVDQTVKALKVDNIAATQENARSGSYAVVRKLYMNTRGNPRGLAKAFIEYIMSPEGSHFIQKHGYMLLQK